MDYDAERISNAQPEMVAFKFFKAAMKSDFIGVDGSKNTQKEYDTIFGSGSWRALLSTSTLMPDKDMANTVDIFWKLPGQKFNIEAKQIEELAPEKRTALLVDVLTKIANKVYEMISNKPSRIALAREMAARFIQDLVHPVLQVNMAELAKTQMKFYYLSKPFAGKQTKKARYICPICNSPFEEGSKASSDLIDKPESHTNRGISHGQFGYITVCNTCKYERILRQLLLGKRASELIVIFPRMNIGPGAGELLIRKAQSLYDKSYIVMVGDMEDPDKRLWLAFTSIIASQVLDQDLYKLESNQLVNMLTYRYGKETRQSNERKLKKALMDAYGNDLESVNEEWGTDFPSWEAATTAVYSNKIVDPTAKEIRSEIYKLYPQMRLVCQTPHMILYPISYPIKLDKDSETNAALRRTFIALILGLTMDASVAIVHDRDQIDFQGGEGVAFVPPVSAVRDLIGANWIPLSDAERWLKFIGISSILANVGQYSERSGLFEVMISPTAGHVLRRIEQKRASENSSLNFRDIAHLRVLEDALRNNR